MNPYKTMLVPFFLVGLLMCSFSSALIASMSDDSASKKPTYEQVKNVLNDTGKSENDKFPVVASKMRHHASFLHNASSKIDMPCESIFRYNSAKLNHSR